MNTKPFKELSSPAILREIKDRQDSALNRVAGFGVHSANRIPFLPRSKTEVLNQLKIAHATLGEAIQIFEDCLDKVEE
jgi:hypothetical protein